VKAWRDWALVVAIVAVAPFALIARRLARRRERKLRAAFIAVVKLSRSDKSLLLELADGRIKKIALARVAEAELTEWGDGINGSAYELGFAIDGLRIRADGWKRELDPLIAAVPQEQRRRARVAPHPDEGDGMLFVGAILMLCVYAVIAATAVALLR
jgi:hypothetical protein